MSRASRFTMFGTHRPIGFYPPARDALYFGVIRKVDSSGLPGLGLRCELFEPEGRLLHSERVPCQPGPGVAAGGHLLATVDVVIPRDCRERAAYLRVELALDPARPYAAAHSLA